MASRHPTRRRRKGPASRFLEQLRSEHGIKLPAPPKPAPAAILLPRSSMTEDIELQSLLSRCAIDGRARAEREELRPSFLREAEISTALQLLTSTEQLHPIILGKARSGKTALAHELMRRIVAGDAPESLRTLPIYEITPASLLAGLQFG